MADKSSIQWTDSTWNPVTGCTKVSPGCHHCYADRMAKRLQGMGVANYANGFKLTLQPHMLEKPLTWRKPRMIFVNSMSDLFHPKIPVEYIQQVFGVMVRAHWHTFQVLTKRADRLAELSPVLPWAPNIWQGVSIESEDYLSRADHLRNTGAQVKFLSLEPLLGPLPNLDLAGIDWVIMGGESGEKYRKVEADWLREVRDKCIAAKVPLHFKQWGGATPKAGGRTLDGRTWDELPGQLMPAPEPAPEPTIQTPEPEKKLVRTLRVEMTIKIYEEDAA